MSGLVKIVRGDLPAGPADALLDHQSGLTRIIFLNIGLVGIKEFDNKEIEEIL